MEQVEPSTGPVWPWDGAMIRQQVEECDSAGAVARSVVQRLLHEALGYDVFDPLSVTADSTGSTTDMELPHPDARVEYAVRRAGVPEILITVWHPGEGADAEENAHRRLTQCLAQSPANVGATTNGMAWRWWTTTREGEVFEVFGWNTAAATAEEGATRDLVSRTGWNPSELRRRAEEGADAERIAWRMAAELTEPGQALLECIAGLVHTGRRTPQVIERMRRAVGRGLTEAVRRACPKCRRTEGEKPAKPPGRRQSGRKTRPRLVVTCGEDDWTPPPAGTVQSALMRHTLDYLITREGAEAAFGEQSRQMKRRVEDLSETAQTHAKNCWSGGGWHTDLSRRAVQKARLLNKLADRLGVKLCASVEALPEHEDDVEAAPPAAPGPASEAGEQEGTAAAGTEEKTGDTSTATPSAAPASGDKQDAAATARAKEYGDSKKAAAGATAEDADNAADAENAADANDADDAANTDNADDADDTDDADDADNADDADDADDEARNTGSTAPNKAVQE